MDKKHVLVVGCDSFNLKELGTIEDADRYNFIPIFDTKTADVSDSLNLDPLLQQASDKINEVGGVDAIICFYDYPFTLLAALLREKYKLPGPTLISSIQCEHKYWSRVEQQKVIPENISAFQAVNPFQQTSLDQLDISTPFWIKPVKSFSSQLGFKIENAQDYEQSIEKIQQNIGPFAHSFNVFLDRVELPEDIKSIDGNYCIAEGIMQGHQCTISGYVYNHEVYSYGLVDSFSYPDTPSFFYYLLPSTLPSHVKERISAISKRVMKQFSFNNSPFNIEFYYDKQEDKIWLLEINPRMSQSHADIYNKVRGRSNHQVLVKLALGEEPHYKKLQGKYACAAKFMYRVFEDGIIEHVPSLDEIHQLEQKYEDSLIHIGVKEGQRLSELYRQDSYSYALGHIMLGAQSQEELLSKYEQIIDDLGVKINKITS